MAFFNSAIEVLQTLVIALGAGLGIWGVINLLEGYGNDNPGGIPPTPYIFLYTLNLYLVKCRQHHGSAFGWTIPTKHHSRQQKTF